MKALDVWVHRCEKVKKTHAVLAPYKEMVILVVPSD